MRDITIKTYCNTLKKNVLTTMPILGSFPDDYVVGRAEGCRYQVEFNCDMDNCPLSKLAHETMIKHNCKSST